MKFLFFSSSIEPSFRIYRTLNTTSTLDNLTTGTSGLSTQSPEFDTKVRDNINKIVRSTSKAEAQNFLKNNLSKEKHQEEDNSEKTNSESTKNKKIQSINSPHKVALENTSVQKEPTVGTHIGLGAKYGALIIGCISAVISVPYGLAVAASAGLGLASALGIAALVILGGVLQGAIDGGIIGAIVGFVRKAIAKREAK